MSFESQVPANLHTPESYLIWPLPVLGSVSSEVRITECSCSNPMMWEAPGRGVWGGAEKAACEGESGTAHWLRWMRASCLLCTAPSPGHNLALLSGAVITGCAVGPHRSHVGFNDSPSLSSNYQPGLEESSPPSSPTRPTQLPGLLV